jgi:hypothetical protein
MTDKEIEKLKALRNWAIIHPSDETKKGPSYIIPHDVMTRLRQIVLSLIKFKVEMNSSRGNSVRDLEAYKTYIDTMSKELYDLTMEDYKEIENVG